MLVGVLDLHFINIGFRVNSCGVSDFTEARFKDYEMYCEMGVLLIQMLY